MSEMCGTRLAETTGRKNDAKLAICSASHNFVWLYLCNNACINNREKIVKQQYLLHIRPHNILNFGLLTAEIFGEFGAPQQILTGFASCVRCVQRRRSTEVNPTFHCVPQSPGLVHCIYIFGSSVPLHGILPRAKFTLCPSTHHRTSLSGYIFATKARIDNRKKTCYTAMARLAPPHVLTIGLYGELRPTSQ